MKGGREAVGEEVEGGDLLGMQWWGVVVVVVMADGIIYDPPQGIDFYLRREFTTLLSD